MDKYLDILTTIYLTIIFTVGLILILFFFACLAYSIFITFIPEKNKKNKKSEQTKPNVEIENTDVKEIQQ